jgi:hypothetical protein
VVKNESGKKIFHLNGEPYFINGEMDKGNWTDGGYLASTKEGWVHDINEAKKMGYNAIKKARRSNPKCSTIYPKFCNRAEIALWADENPVLSGINPDKTGILKLPFSMGVPTKTRFCPGLTLTKPPYIGGFRHFAIENLV